MTLCSRCLKGEVFHSFTEYCFSCLQELNKERVTDNILSGEETETYGEDDIVCPYCGSHYEPFDVDEEGDYFDESEYDYKCCDCGHEFVYEASVSVTFSTRRK